MTLPVSGAISFNNINVELGVAGATQASLGQASYRTLAGVASGAISMSNFYGKANAFSGTIAANQTNFNLRTWALANGWNGTVAATITINSGIYVYSTSTGTPGMTIDGSWPGGITVVNNGYILGMGGAGGYGSNTLNYAGQTGFAGGTAINLGVSCTITNNNVIGGGGGGGGGGNVYHIVSSGGGGGGGRTGLTNSSGGASSGGSWPSAAGSPGTSSSGGAGGAGSSGYGQPGGAGGTWGATGSTGGAWNASPLAGGAGGNAIKLNGYTATRNGSGTTYGAVS